MSGKLKTREGKGAVAVKGNGRCDYWQGFEPSYKFILNSVSDRTSAFFSRRSAVRAAPARNAALQLAAGVAPHAEGLRFHL